MGEKGQFSLWIMSCIFYWLYRCTYSVLFTKGSERVECCSAAGGHGIVVAVGILLPVDLAFAEKILHQCLIKALELQKNIFGSMLNSNMHVFPSDVELII